MKVTLVLSLVAVFAASLLFLSISPVYACDPSKGDYTDCPATPTETISATATATSLISVTPAITIPSTLTPTVTVTVTQMATPTATMAATETVTPTYTATSTQTPTFTPTVVQTPTPLATATITQTPTPTSIAIRGEGLSLACLMPDADSSSNALGVVDKCTAIPVQVIVPKSIPTLAPTVVVKIVATPTPLQPKGDAPSSAKTISDAWQMLDAGAVAWYRIDNGNSFFLDVWLDASAKQGITLAMYSPEQTNALSVDLPPKGRGAPAKGDATHDLVWKGSSATGVWYALVRNYNAFPVQYKIGSLQSSADRNCVTYGEWLPTGQYVQWTDCGHYGDPTKK